MKKFLIVTLLTLSMIVFVSCGGSSKKDKNNHETTNDEDTTDTIDDSDNTDTSDEAETPDNSDTETPSNCTGLSLDLSAPVQTSANKFYVTNEDYDPVLQMQFYQNEETGAISEGTYDLGSESNSSYATCTECVFLLSDYVEAASEEEESYYSKIYYQKSGSLTIEKVDESNNIVGTITAVLAEATIDDDTLETTFAEEGACFEIETASFDSGYEEPCVPQCDGKECGYDGCGGICGSCENGKGCDAAFKCVDFELPATCSTISIDWDTFESYGAGYGYYYTDSDPAATIELYDEIAIGTYDLGNEMNLNYSTCTECVRLTDGEKKYFQYSGELVVSGLDKDENISGTLTGIFVETYFGGSADEYVSTPVAGGSCVKIEAASFDSGVCIPHCEEGWECGNDGCGGMCGSGCDGQACSAEHQCVPFECDQLEIGEFELVAEDFYGLFTYYYYDAYTSGKGVGSESVPDLFEIGFNTEVLTTGIVELTGDYDNMGDAYVVLYEDYDVENQTLGKTYFQESGTLNFTEVKADTMESKGNSPFIRVVEIDNDVLPVPGGKCYEVEDISWNTTSN